MNILLLGSGGREHALAWKLSQSHKCDQLYIAPGNAGTSRFGINAELNILDFKEVAAFSIDKNISMIVVGPEDPLVNGIADFFEADQALKHIPVIGPRKEGARLEGSKDFSKKFMMRNKIPTAGYTSVTLETLNDGILFLDTMKSPFVLKADGLAAGKGVLIIDDRDEAKKELKSILENSRFGNAGKIVIIEEFLSGIELSVFVLTDGKSYVILPEAKDYKRIGENDTGLNTGGMGAVSPVNFADETFMRITEEQIILPTIEGLKKEGIKYKGFIFIGLMNSNGKPFVIEYNARLGDPETEVIIPRLKNDLVDLFTAVADENLASVKIETDHRTAVTVMLVSGGYPGVYEKGKIISGIEDCKNSFVFHAGTSEKDGNVITSGGRVLAITSLNESFADARNTSMQNAEKISFENKYYRKDIGLDLLLKNQIL